MTRSISVVCSAMCLALIGSTHSVDNPAGSHGKQADKAAVMRTRATIRMLDDVYKTAIVLMTKKYVVDDTSYPAGRVAKLMFAEISKKGTHKVRLIDVSGKPYNAKNVAKDDFEKKGVEHLRKGKQYFEKIETKDGKNWLRAMTFVPVVMQRCVLCHPNYKTAKKGAAIGAISYTIEIK